MYYLYVIFGFIILIKGADVLIVTSSKLAKVLNIPPIIFGLTILAFGTSAPEAAIGIFSGLKETNMIALGDVIGSSIANIALIIGITTLIVPMKVPRTATTKKIPISIVFQVIFLALAFSDNNISTFDGLILIVVFVLYIIYLIISKSLISKVNDGIQSLKLPENRGKHVEKIGVEIRRFLAGISGLIIGGNLIVNGSLSIAPKLGMSESLIGLTIVAIGTALPDLITYIMSIIKKKGRMAIGNIIGSNIFNILFVMGISAMIYPIPVSSDLIMDIFLMIFATCLLYLITLINSRITRIGGFILLFYYFSYLYYRIFYN